jgi:hypothetical protein
MIRITNTFAVQRKSDIESIYIRDAHKEDAKGVTNAVCILHRHSYTPYEMLFKSPAEAQDRFDLLVEKINHRGWL